MKLWLTHPTGNEFVRGLLSGLDRREVDFDFFTTVGFSRANSRRRRCYQLRGDRLHTYPAREIGRLIYQKLLKTAPPAAHALSVDNVYRSLDRHVASCLSTVKSRPDVVYAFEDGALETFRTARQLNVTRVYDLPIAFWETAQRLLTEEGERYPDWAPTVLVNDLSDEKRERKTEELLLADVIVCPSEFVLSSLPAEARRAKKCVVSAFGSPEVPATARDEKRRALRLLFAGSLTQRKGLADVFAALRLLQRSDVELTIVGAPLLPLDFYRQQWSQFSYEGPRSHTGMLKLMREADVLVLPSIVEGRALVQQEALACGLPLIVTHNAGGSDLVEEGRTGFLVPIRSPEAIADKINWFAENRHLLPEMRMACRRKAAEYSWAGYAERILDELSAPNAEALALQQAHL